MVIIIQKFFHVSLEVFEVDDSIKSLGCITDVFSSENFKRDRKRAIYDFISRIFFSTKKILSNTNSEFHLSELSYKFIDL